MHGEVLDDPSDYSKKGPKKNPTKKSSSNQTWQWKSTTIYSLVGGLEHVLFSIIYGIILPIDFHVFQRGWNHQLVVDVPISTSI